MIYNGYIGPPGAGWISGVGAPAAVVGGNGDFYLDTSISAWWGPKDAVTFWVGTGPHSLVGSVTEANVRAALALSAGAVAVNSQKITGLAPGVAVTDAANVSQLGTSILRPPTPTALAPTIGNVVLDGSVNNNFTLSMTGNVDLGQPINFVDNQSFRITYKCNGFTLTANTLFWKMPGGGGLLANPSLPAGVLEGYYSAFLGFAVYVIGDNIQ